MSEPDDMPGRRKLEAVTADDYPAATEIILSFPEKWEWVCSFNWGSHPTYVAAFPVSYEPVRGDHFFGLSREINRSLTQYHLYQLFEPWPRSIFLVAWDEVRREGRALGGGHLRVHLQPIGQAQVWQGATNAVIWECYFYDTRRRGEDWQERLAQFWAAVEKDIKAEKIFTQPQEPSFSEGYTEFLARLGYTSDLDFEHWWVKKR